LPQGAIDVAIVINEGEFVEETCRSFYHPGQDVLGEVRATNVFSRFRSEQMVDVEVRKSYRAVLSTRIRGGATVKCTSDDEFDYLINMGYLKRMK
jgi:hypothetical protein